MKHHILIVDDDEMIQAMVSFLAKDGVNVRTTQVGTGTAMHETLARDSVDLMILDLGLPDEDGLALARQVRARSDVPIIVVTGDRSRESLIAALEIGVDDFLTKPFDPYELQLRIRNRLRRSGNAQPERRGPIASGRSGFAGHVIDFAGRSLTDPKGEIVHLTPNEFNVLAALVRKPKQALSRNQILDALASGDDPPSDRSVDVYINQIRKKIETDPTKPGIIRAVRGVGYMLAAAVEPVT